MLFRKKDYTVALMLYLAISHVVERSVIYRFLRHILSHGYFKKIDILIIGLGQLDPETPKYLKI